MKTLREYLDQLDEIDRRGFLKGIGAAAVAGAAGSVKAQNKQFTPEQIEELLQYVSQRPYGFLFVDLKTSDPDKMYQDSLVQYLRPT